MNTESRFHHAISETAAAGLLTITLLAASACSGSAPFAPDGGPSNAARVAEASVGATADDTAAPAFVSFGPADSSNLSSQPEGVASSAARSYASPVPGSCIRLFYDPSFYKWLAFQNLCSQSIYIVYIANNPGYGGSAMTLRPGQKSSTGYNAAEVQAKRGYQLFACPAGYYPVDSLNRYVSRVNTSFKCLKQ
jgi:hypothetical protein